MTDIFYILECRVKNCVADFYLNDIPVFRRSDELGAFAAGPYHELLLAGRNELAIVVEPGDTPSTALSGGGARNRVHRTSAMAEAKVVRYPAGVTVGDPSGELIGAARWDHLDGAGPVVFPLVRSGVFEHSPAEEPWEWEKGERLRLEPELAGIATKLVNQLRIELTLGDAETFLKVTKPRVADIARAYGNSSEDKERNYVEWIKLEAPKWFFEPIKPEALDFRLCGRDRLVELARRDGEPMLRCLPGADGSQTSFPLYLGKLNGEWLVTL